MNKECIGQLIIELRRRHDMSQKELSERLNIAPSTLCKWEHGINMPDIDTLSNLSDIFHVSGDALFHPEVALQMMKKDVDKEETANTTLKDNSDKSTLFLKKHVIVVMSVLMVVLTSIGFFIAFEILRPNFEVIDVRHKPEDSQDTYYQISVLCSGSIRQTDYYEYLDMIRDKWEEVEVDDNTEIIEVYFYQNREDAEIWSWTDDIMIIVL